MPNVFWAAFGGGAAAGLITLIALLTVEWFKRFLDRPLIKVSMSLGFLFGTTYMTTPDPSRGSNRQVFFEAINPHTKPVTLSGFGLYYNRPEWGFLQVFPQAGYQFPYQLDGGKSLQQWTSMEELLKNLKKDKRTPRDLKWAWFRASSGKIYRGKIEKWVIRELEKEFQKMNEPLTPSPSP